MRKNTIVGGVCGLLGALVSILLGLDNNYLNFGIGIGFFTLFFYLLFYFISKEFFNKNKKN